MITRRLLLQALAALGLSPALAIAKPTHGLCVAKFKDNKISNYDELMQGVEYQQLLQNSWKRETHVWVERNDALPHMCGITYKSEIFWGKVMLVEHLSYLSCRDEMLAWCRFEKTDDSDIIRVNNASHHFDRETSLKLYNKMSQGASGKKT